MTSPLARVGAQSGALTTNQALSVFDTPAGQQGCTFQFNLRDAATDRLVRVLTPYADTVPVLTHDTTRTIKRSLSLSLGVSDTAAVDPIKHRVTAHLVDYTGRSWRLGRYMFSDFSRALTSAGRLASPALMDESFIVDQARESAFPSPNTGKAMQVRGLINDVMDEYPTIGAAIETTVFETTNSWSFGTTNFQILSDLATQGAYFPPWMANDRKLHMIQSFDPATRVPDVDWDRYPHVISSSIVETDDLLTAPNRFVVVSNNPSSTTTAGTPIVGSYDIPTSAPNSIQNRGFVVPLQQQLQLTSQTQAQAVAAAIGVNATVYQRVSMTTFPDARHDSYNVVRWQGTNWLELSWSMNMIAGGAMTHTLRKSYR